MNILVLSCSNEAEVVDFHEAVQSCCISNDFILGDKLSLGVSACFLVERDMGYCHAEVEITTWDSDVMAKLERAIAHLV